MRHEFKITKDYNNLLKKGNTHLVSVDTGNVLTQKGVGEFVDKKLKEAADKLPKIQKKRGPKPKAKTTNKKE